MINGEKAYYLLKNAGVSPVEFSDKYGYSKSAVDAIIDTFGEMTGR